MTQISPPEQRFVDRYSMLFQTLPIGILEEDFSYAKSVLDRKGFDNKQALRTFLQDNPDELIDLVKNVHVIDFNTAGLKIYHADKLEEYWEFYQDTERWWDAGWTNYYIRCFEALYANELPLNCEHVGTTTAIDGGIIYVRYILQFAPGHEKDWSRVITFVIDITERKIYEQNLIKIQQLVTLHGLCDEISGDLQNLLCQTKEGAA